MSARIAGAAGGVLLLTLLGVWGASEALRIREIRRQIEAVEREIATFRTQAARLAETVDRLRHDPAYIEKLAREEHGLVRAGETVLKFPTRGQ